MNQTDVTTVEVANEAGGRGVTLVAEATSPRGAGAWAHVGSVLVIALVACAAVFHGWKKGQVLAPTDALRLVAPWEHGHGDYVAANEQLLDQTIQFVPWTIYTVERYRAGQIPLWNPHAGLGQPFLANGQSAVFYPTILLHWWLPETWSWTVSAALRLFVAGIGVYVLAGRYGVMGVPRLLAAVAFMLCGFNVVWLNHPQMNVMPLLPWAVLVTELLVERVTLWRVIGGGVVFGVQFLGGHPASCIHLLVACGLVWGMRLFVLPEPVGRGPRAARLNVLVGGLGFAAAVVLGFALAAAQWLPLIEYANHSGATLVRKEKVAGQLLIAFDPRYLIGIAFPYANGYPDGVTPFEIRQATKLPNTNELAPGFVGTVPLVLALFAVVTFRRRGVVILWAVVGLVAAAIAVKLPGVDHLVRKVPGLNVSQNARLLVVTALALSILAGIGLQGLTTFLRQGLDVPRLRKGVKWVAIGAAALAVVAAAVLYFARNPILNRGYAKAEEMYNASAAHEHSLEHVKGVVRRVHKELLITTARVGIPVGVLVVVWVMLAGHRRKLAAGGGGEELGQGPQAGRLNGGVRSLATSPWPWFVLALVDLLAFAVPFNPGSPRETYYTADGATIQKLKELPEARAAGTFRTLLPEAATAYGINDLRGYDALGTQRYYRWWAHEGIGDLPAHMQGYLSRLENPEHPAWSLLNFGYLVTALDQPAPPAERFTRVDGPDDAAVYRAAALRPRAWVAPKAQVYDTADEVFDRIGKSGEAEKLDFDPDHVVLLDKEIARADAEMVQKDPTVWSRSAGGGTPRVEFVGPAKKDDDRPEVVRLRVSNNTGGYLVLADAWFPGWTATVVDTRNNGSAVPILPAYGTLRAVPLPANASTVTVEFRYRPWSWRVGALTSVLAVCLFLLLAGAATFRPRNLKKTENLPQIDTDAPG